MSVLVVGSVNADLIVRAPHIPAPGETVLGGDAIALPGGKGANQAVACARAGAHVHFCGAVGHDAFAAIATANLRADGVNLDALHTLDAPTGLALITVSAEGENAITVASGANAHMTPGHLPDLHGTDVLLLQLELPLSVVEAAAQQAKRAGAHVLLNAAPARTLPAELLQHIDTLILNEGELTAVAGAGSTETQARALLSRGPHTVIVTLGGDGSLAVTADGTHQQAALPVNVVDTTGAGDTFCGAFAAALASGQPLPDALRFANVAGALATTQLGAQAAMPTHAEIQAHLST
ncbi:ribokinase [Deinococcus maricopensis]|uniref:Ribokinase n=1 Tax=Deinococcus maricopensis (strain DSM 21211 / LMG 22137 / NRRL B-23946 / LB-34) TaxID=709986 RepID=E8U6R0_DEIML|nr:ribokinase [Deinococcus maricopensis]ADV66749.1 Ribokinase [Deinococcus maricopensis DSM 21211]